MANWAWPHTPEDNMARMLLVGGPFNGETAFFLPPDTGAPIQIVWGAWFPWGFDAWLYEWNGETAVEQGRTQALIYRPIATVAADAISPSVATNADLNSAALEARRRTAMHEPTDACAADHCYAHDEDEPGIGYITCGECGHLYRTARELRRAYRRIVWGFWREDHHLRSLWNCLTIRASRIYFCQHCIHDF